MSMITTTQSEVRLARLLDERDINTQKHENLLAAIEVRDDKSLTETEREHIAMYREKSVTLDADVEQLSSDIEAARTAMETSKKIRRALAGAADGVEVDGDGIVYRDFYTYARDFVLTRDSGLGRRWSNEGEQLAMRERLQLMKRETANTLSSNVGGLQPPSYIAQIMQVIDKSRPIVASAKSIGLDRGTITYPKVTQRPLVAVQASEKTAGGNQGMVVEMETTTASTYLGGGDISWQALNWSTPDALQLWFDLAAASYALQTETDAGTVIEASARHHVVSDRLTGTTSDTFADWLAAIAEGAGVVYAASGRLSDTLYVAPDMFYMAAALTSDSFPQLSAAGRLNIGSQSGDIAGLRVVLSKGLDAGVALVGDSQALICGETPGAPVELRVVEPAIGGVEVGLIGAFEAVVVDDGAFALLGTTS